MKLGWNGGLMRRIMMMGLGAAIVAGITGSPAEAKKNNMGPTEAAIIAGAAGLAIGAAVADSKHRNNKRIDHDGYEPPYPPGGYDPYFNRAFSPDKNVVCYPAQRLCYNNNGSVANRWTRRVYGY